MTVNDGSRCGVSKLISTYGDPGVNIGASWATTVVFGPQVDIPSLELTNDILQTNIFVVQDTESGRLKKLNSSTLGSSCTCNSPTEIILEKSDQSEELILTSNDTSFIVIPGMVQTLGAEDFGLVSSNPLGLPFGARCRLTKDCDEGLLCCAPPFRTSLPARCTQIHLCPTALDLEVQLSATVQLLLLPISSFENGAVLELAFFVNETLQNPPFEFMVANSTEVDTSVLASIELTIEDLALQDDPFVFSTRIRYSDQVQGTDPGNVQVGSTLQTDPNHGVLNTIASLDTIDNDTSTLAANTSGLLQCECSSPILPSISSATERVVGSFSRNSSVVCGTSSSIASLSFESDGSSHLFTEAFGPLNLTSLGSTLQVQVILDGSIILTSQTFRSTTSSGTQEGFASSNITPGTISSGSHTLTLECSLVGGTSGTGIVSATSTNQAQLNFFLLP
jgi:hypothetical protein